MSLQPSPRATFDAVTSLIQAGNYAEAGGMLAVARAAAPDNPSLLGLAAWLAGLTGDHDASLAYYRALSAQKPDHAETRFNLHRAEAIVAERAGDLPAALDALGNAAHMVPGDAGLAAQIMLLERRLCRWGTPRTLPPGLPPAAVLVVAADDPAAQAAAARQWAARLAGITPLHAAPPRQPGPLRLGFLSSDWHDHATAYLCAGIFALFDRREFAVHIYGYGVDDGSALRRRIAAAADSFTDLAGLDAAGAAARIRAGGIDLLIDLKGHTRGGRIDILAHRPAPLQLHWLGFPGTTGCSFVDYFIGDATALPPTLRPHFTEKIIELPGSYQPNDRARPLPAALPRLAYGLPENAFVFASFNQPYKLTPPLLHLWAAILHDAPQSVLWLLGGHAEAEGNIRAFMTGQNIDPARLFFAPPLPLAEHLARYHAADLALDTFPVGGHTTTSDALWLGTPAVTLPGASFVSRVGASLLRAAGLPELIAADEASYRALATDLAQDQARLAALKNHLIAGRLDLPLFDTESFVKNLSGALKHAWRRHETGLPPDHLPAEGI